MACVLLLLLQGSCPLLRPLHPSLGLLVEQTIKTSTRVTTHTMSDFLIVGVCTPLYTGYSAQLQPAPDAVHTVWGWHKGAVPRAGLGLWLSGFGRERGATKQSTCQVGGPRAAS